MIRFGSGLDIGLGFLNENGRIWVGFGSDLDIGLAFYNEKMVSGFFIGPVQVFGWVFYNNMGSDHVFGLVLLEFFFNETHNAAQFCIIPLTPAQALSDSELHNC